MNLNDMQHTWSKLQQANYCEANYCEHNRRKKTCRECGGSAFCEHNRIKYSCKECKRPRGGAAQKKGIAKLKKKKG